MNGFIAHLYTWFGTKAVTVPPLISTIHKSPQHPPSLFQPAVSSPAVPWQRLLAAEILQLHALKFSHHRFRTDLVAPIVFLITPLHGPIREPRFQQYLYCCVSVRLLGEQVYRAVAQKRPWCIRLSRDRCIAAVLHATVRCIWHYCISKYNRCDYVRFL
jgi:hypothetical protein